MKHSLMTSVALIAALSSALPAGADDTPDPVTQATEAANARAALVNAQAAAVNAQAALVKARSDSLALPEYSGKTTTDGTTGVMESWILSGSAITAAATAIAKQVNDAIPRSRAAAASAEKKADATLPVRPVLIVDAGESLNFGLPATLLNEMGTLRRSVDHVLLLETCAPPVVRKEGTKPKKGARDSDFGASIDLEGLLAESRGASPAATGAAIVEAASGGSILPIASAVLSALKTETTVTGQTIAPDGRTLIDALAGQVAGAAIPSELVSAASIDQTRLGIAWNDLVTTRNHAFACRALLAPHEDKDGVKARITVLDSAIQAVDVFAVRTTQSENAGPSQLVRAALLDELASRNPLVLRVSIEQAGGSLWKRDSLWTMVGFSGVRLTGGLVVSFRLTDPATGAASTGGLVVCRTDFASMKKIQAGPVSRPNCTAPSGDFGGETRPSRRAE